MLIKEWALVEYASESYEGKPKSRLSFIACMVVVLKFECAQYESIQIYIIDDRRIKNML